MNLLAGRGNFNQGKYNFSRPKAGAVYRDLLENIDCLPDAWVMSVACHKSSQMYGNRRLEAAMYALFQRMRRKCVKADVNAMTFFDCVIPEYISFIGKLSDTYRLLWLWARGRAVLRHRTSPGHVFQGRQRKGFKALLFHSDGGPDRHTPLSSR